MLPLTSPGRAGPSLVVQVVFSFLREKDIQIDLSEHEHELHVANQVRPPFQNDVWTAIAREAVGRPRAQAMTSTTP